MSACNCGQPSEILLFDGKGNVQEYCEGCFDKAMFIINLHAKKCTVATLVELPTYCGDHRRAFKYYLTE